MNDIITYVNIGDLQTISQLNNLDDFIILKLNLATQLPELKRINKQNFLLDIMQGSGPVRWSDVVELPTGIHSLSNAVGTGLFYSNSAGFGAYRSIETADVQRIIVQNKDAQLGNPTIDLATVTDTGGGVLQRTAFDAYGRKIGTSTASTDDLPEGENRYFTEARAATAAPVQEAPSDDVPRVRKNGNWVELPPAASTIDGGFF